jgi:UDP-N-acetylglucosamine:LPS N-acetylglucosamine transferase
MNAPDRLTAMAAAAKTAGTVDAADRLADLVLQVAGLLDRPLNSFQAETER